MEFDQETAKAMRDGKQHLDIVKSEDWLELRALMEAKMAQLFKDVDITKPDEILGQDIKANMKAIGILEDFISTIQGSAYQFEVNSELLIETEDFFKRD